MHLTDERLAGRSARARPLEGGETPAQSKSPTSRRTPLRNSGWWRLRGNRMAIYLLTHLVTARCQAPGAASGLESGATGSFSRSRTTPMANNHTRKTLDKNQGVAIEKTSGNNAIK